MMRLIASLPVPPLRGFAILILLCAGGCAGTSQRGGADNGASPAGGMSLTLKAELALDSWAFYRVDPDGTICYGGGADARDGKVSWIDQMSDEEIAELKSLIAEHGWFDREPASVGEPADRRYTITIAGPEGRRKYSVAGDSPQVMPVLGLLDRIARRRFDEFLQELPKPSGGQ